MVAAMELELRGITKRFPGVVANRDVSLTIRSGEVLALLGENGAGKSTLMNILYGLYHADEGEILIDGTAVTFSSPGDAIAAGVGMVHQHFMLVPNFTVAENLILGVEPVGPLGKLNMSKARKMVTEYSDRYHLGLDPDGVIEELPVGVQQRVEIVKVLSRHAKVVVFDEPTAVLTPQEIEEFFNIVAELKAAGTGIVFITHKLKETLRIADRIMVLRRGEVVGSADPRTATEDDLAEMMVGRDVQLIVDKSVASPGADTLVVEDLMVRDASGRALLDSISFRVRAGEIVGVAGVQGNGQSELVEMLTGLRTATSGTIRLAGQEITPMSPRERHDVGVAHIPEDRQRMGLIKGFSVTENLVLTDYHQAPYSSGISMDWERCAQNARQLIDDFDIRTPSEQVGAGTLSGGNQQKVIVARELRKDLKLVIASQPTRGVDVGSIEYIHSRIVAQRDAGVAVLVVSTELDEITALSDRVIVMFQGRIVADRPREGLDHATIGLYMAGALDDFQPLDTLTSAGERTS
jgi:general nucleoside transport system ATP-binding protein